MIDTIGLSTQPLSFVDNYRTPHTDKLHVVERWKIIDKGQRIEVSFTVDDPGAFTMPWSGMMRYRHRPGQRMEEFSCPENNSDFFHLDDYTIPTANKADF